MYENIIAIHNVLKKHYIIKFSTSSIFKKISKNNFETNFFFLKQKKSILSKNKHVKKKPKPKKKNYYYSIKTDAF